MIEDILIILNSPTIISALGSATVISMALSSFLYNGYYSKIWRALAVIGGFSISMLILFSGLEKIGQVDFSLMTTAIVITFLTTSMGFFLGVFIYRREDKRSEKKNGVSCYFNSCEIQIKK